MEGRKGQRIFRANLYLWYLIPVEMLGPFLGSSKGYGTFVGKKKFRFRRLKGVRYSQQVVLSSPVYTVSILVSHSAGGFLNIYTRCACSFPAAEKISALPLFTSLRVASKSPHSSTQTKPLDLLKTIESNFHSPPQTPTPTPPNSPTPASSAPPPSSPGSPPTPSPSNHPSAPSRQPAGSTPPP